MKKYLSLALTVIVAVLLISCVDIQKKPAQKNDIEKAVVTAAFVEDVEVSDEYHEFILVDSIYTTKVVFSTDKPVTDFKFFNLDADGFASDGTYLMGEVFYELQDFTPEKPVVIGMGFAGTMPSNAICFTNNDGTAEYYYLNLSGKDGSLIFEKFELGNKAW